MPEEFWTDNYVTEGPLRIDSCRFIWPKLSFIRKCVSLSGYVKEGTTARIDKKITDTSVHHKGRTLGRRHSAPTGLYDSPAKQKTKQEVLKNFEKVRNSHEKPIKCPSASKKRNREVLYSDDEALAMSSEEEDAVGNSLYFRVRENIFLYFYKGYIFVFCTFDTSSYLT